MPKMHQLMPKMHRCHEISWSVFPPALQSDTCCAKPEDVQSVQGMPRDALSYHKPSMAYL